MADQPQWWEAGAAPYFIAKPDPQPTKQPSSAQKAEDAGAAAQAIVQAMTQQQPPPPAAAPQQSGGGDAIGNFLFGDQGGGGAMDFLGQMGNWVVDSFSPSTIGSNLTAAFPGGGNSAPDAVATDPVPVATGVAKAGLAKPTDASAEASVNPLSTQLYFAQNIAPLLAQIMGKADQQSKDFLGMAQKGSANMHLPSSYRGIFESMLPRQQAAHADVMASLAGAAVAAPALDSLQRQIAEATSQATKNYYAQQAAQAAIAQSGVGAIPTSTEVTGG